MTVRNSIRIKDFFPKGEVLNFTGIKPLLEGLSVEFNRLYDTLALTLDDLISVSIRTTEGTEAFLDRLLPSYKGRDKRETFSSIYNLNLVDAKTFIVALQGVKSVSTKVQLEEVIAIYGLTVTVSDTSKVPFTVNYTHVQFPIYQDEISSTFDVNASGLSIEDQELLKVLVDIYKPANTHSFFN